MSGLDSTNPTRSGWFQPRAALAGLRALADSVFHQPAVRSRCWIILATFLVLGYAVGVLSYALVTPEIGIRCAFTPEVNYFYPEFLYPRQGQDPLRSGDKIVRLADQPVENWSHFLR